MSLVPVYLVSRIRLSLESSCLVVERLTQRSCSFSLLSRLAGFFFFFLSFAFFSQQDLLSEGGRALICILGQAPSLARV